jgi:hypothetical protein
VLINYLKTSVATFKFVDDVTMTEVTDTTSSQMQAAGNEVVRWSDANLMNINIWKSKDMLMGRIIILSPSVPAVALFFVFKSDFLI